MIIDSLQNAEKYYGVHPLFKQAFEWIKSQDLSSLEVGKWEIAEGLKAGTSDKEAYTTETAKFECHNNWMDIQVALSPRETFGYSERSTVSDPAGEYNSEKDVIFWKDKPGTYFDLQFGQFAVFFPEDVHAPQIGEGNVKKLVVKIKI
ncbi:YhcH/YjgK/YiaL family protein [Desertivirga arenae]|uniref:YhcH/YjgK/YiaL family protein n=1 Tax=Desertivirga arenae TaxID=2810309 RepID=UPI001A972586|nr:YhcH/YjgK/YiaL family protein [Pedobacter sp. SYSU D00823]